MADQNTPRDRRWRKGDDDAESTPTPSYEQEPMEVEQDDLPRRAASARFDVDTEIGSEAALRDAMDPANQSLAEALQLSFKVLQLVILVMIVLFLVSSCQTVHDDETGVHTVFGKIDPISHSEALTPGLKWGIWPYPVGEFVLFHNSNRTVHLGDVFAPSNRGGLTQDQLLERANINNPLNPGRDGSLLTRDGDLAHMHVGGRYSIEQPVQFVEQIDDADTRHDSNRIVQLMLQRATIHVAASESLQELVDISRVEIVKSSIKQKAQDGLDTVHAGIQLAQVEVTEAEPPLAIAKAFGDLQNAVVEAQTASGKASQEADKTLIAVAGQGYRTLITAIDRYEDAIAAKNDQDATKVFSEICEHFEGKDFSGEVASIIAMARSYSDTIDATMGNQARRFESLLPAYLQHPEMVIRQRWLEAYANVLKKPDCETIWVPSSILSMEISLSGSNGVQDLRRKNDYARREAASNAKAINPDGPYILRGSEMINDQAGRQLQRDYSGRLIPFGGSSSGK
jgi:membrane protease subunit HflK